MEPPHIALSKLSEGRLQRSARASKDLNTIYLNIPKCGCTTIKTFLWKMVSDERYTNKKQFLPDKKGSFSFSNQAMIDFDRAPLVFTFVRNPFTRIYSSYNDKVVAPFDYPEKIFLGPIKDVFLKRKSHSFKEFLLWIAETPDHRRNAHWRSMSYQSICETVKPTFVGSVENMDKDLEALRQKIVELNADKTLNPHEVKNRNSMDSMNTIEDAYGPEEIALVQEIFSNDFENFGYSTIFGRKYLAPRKSNKKEPTGKKKIVRKK